MIFDILIKVTINIFDLINLRKLYTSQRHPGGLLDLYTKQKWIKHIDQTNSTLIK